MPSPWAVRARCTASASRLIAGAGGGSGGLSPIGWAPVVPPHRSSPTSPIYVLACIVGYRATKREHSIELLELLFQVSGLERIIVADLRDDLLALAAEDEAHEFAGARVKFSARRLIHVEIGVAAQRVGAVGDVVGGERHRGAAATRRDGEHSQVGKIVHVHQ